MVRLGDGNRRDFFRDSLGEWFGRVIESAEERVVAKRYYRPPGALPEVGFVAACSRCGECINVCPVHAIVKVPPDGGFAAGTPHIEPAYQPCIACPDMPCAKACPTGALTVPEQGWQGLHMGTLELLTDRCITFHGSECSVCAKACPVGSAALTTDAGGHPVIRAEGCVGCGVCVRACVTSPSSLVLSQVER